MLFLQRIAAITVTLQHSLERSFEESLETGQADVLRQCLRTYATIDKMRDAEALFRKIAVKPYMDEVGQSLETGQADVLRQCPHTYTTIDRMRDAETLFRKIAVKAIYG